MYIMHVSELMEFTVCLCFCIAIILAAKVLTCKLCFSNIMLCSAMLAVVDKVWSELANVVVTVQGERFLRNEVHDRII